MATAVYHSVHVFGAIDNAALSTGQLVFNSQSLPVEQAHTVSHVNNLIAQNAGKGQGWSR